MLHVLPLVTYTEGKSGQIKHSGYIQYTYTKLHRIINKSRQRRHRHHQQRHFAEILQGERREEKFSVEFRVPDEGEKSCREEIFVCQSDENRPPA
jgi:hypothetical protein